MTPDESLMRLAMEALLDLGACDDPECREQNCNHALVALRARLDEPSEEAQSGARDAKDEALMRRAMKACEAVISIADAIEGGPFADVMSSVDLGIIIEALDTVEAAGDALRARLGGNERDEVGVEQMAGQRDAEKARADKAEKWNEYVTEDARKRVVAAIGGEHKTHAIDLLAILDYERKKAETEVERLEKHNKEMEDWLESKACALAVALGLPSDQQRPPMDRMIARVETMTLTLAAQRILKKALAAKEAPDDKSEA